ncbi:hypothetical protein HK405_015525, partial [Cladochytrium tenue]
SASAESGPLMSTDTAATTTTAAALAVKPAAAPAAPQQPLPLLPPPLPSPALATAAVAAAAAIDPAAPPRRRRRHQTEVQPLSPKADEPDGGGGDSGPPLARAERRARFGVDCADLVHFTHWEPGGEYVKHLAVKNVVMKTQKIRYRLPKTRFFSMDFPETQTLSAGMSWTIPITFRPVAKEPYQDSIEFATAAGRFRVPVKATLPEHALAVPPAVDFRLCPVRETARRSFVLRNVGDLPSVFRWDVPEPFAIEPKSGSLEPGQSVTVSVVFKPESASVFTASAVCAYGDPAQWSASRVLQSTTIYGIAKFSHLAVRAVSPPTLPLRLAAPSSIPAPNAAQPPQGRDGTVAEAIAPTSPAESPRDAAQTGPHHFDFGRVAVGTFATLRFLLENPSPVHANFKIKPAERGGDPFFSFSALSGSVPSGGKTEIEVEIQPHYRPSSSSNPTSPQTTFLVEPHSTFHIDRPWGIVNANSSVALTIRFAPSDPINYHRRVYCLVENQDGVFVDLIGTCYNEKKRPATFHPKAIENYRCRVENGLGSFGPEQLEELLKGGKVICVDGVLSFADVADRADRQDIRVSFPFSTVPFPDHPYPDGQVASELFFENASPDRAVSLLDPYVDFGCCSRYRMIDNRVIRLENRTSGKMSCVWRIPGEDSNDGPSGPVFSIAPRTTDIQPRSVAEFRVSFRPSADDTFYGLQLECFVYFKSMRNFRLVHPDTFTPSWCLTPTVAGNTFSPGTDSFIPKVDFGVTRLDFPACHVDRSVYRTVRVTNTGDTPVKFAFPDHLSVGVAVGSDLPAIRRIYERALKCYFNGSMSNSQDIHVRGVGYVPDLSFENGNMLCFKPTCVGTIAARTFTVQNHSRILVYYEWKIPGTYSGFVSIRPARGSLEPNGSAMLTCFLSPVAARSFLLRLPCYFSHGRTVESSGHSVESAERVYRTTLTVVGKGALATLVADPTNVEYGAVLVNAIVEREVAIFNPSESDVFYDLEIYRVTTTEPQFVEPTDDDASAAALPRVEVETRLCNDVRLSEIDILQSTDILPARSRQFIKIRVCIREQTEHRFRIYYHMKPSSLRLHSALVPSDHGLHIKQPAAASRVLLCDVQVIGVHPVVRVTDTRSLGVAKALIWQYFSIDRFNKVLESVDPSDAGFSGRAFVLPDAGETLDFPTAASAAQSLLLREPPSVDFHFGAAPVGCGSAVVHLDLMNPGVVPVEWVFFFPNDLEVEVETWADPGDYTEEQIHTNLILDNGLFSVSPKGGVLKPGESEHITLSYRHDLVGFHKLPVVFKLKNGSSRAGKEMVVYFAGLTVQPDVKCLFLLSNRHSFRPVSVGTAAPPLQSFRLANNGCVSLEYMIDVAPLKALCEAEHGFEVMRCLNERGRIPPGGVHFVDWVFRPLEEKEYEVDIPIHLDDGQVHIVTFCGAGTRDSDVTLADPKSLYDTIPPVQTLKSFPQAASLSLERINFGHVPLGATLRQLVVVTNLLSDSDISFSWSPPAPSLPSDDAAPAYASPALKVTPSTGRLRPGEYSVCKVVFTATAEFRVLERDLVCEIVNETSAVRNERGGEMRRVIMPALITFVDASAIASKEAADEAMREYARTSVRPLSALTVTEADAPPSSPGRPRGRRGSPRGKPRGSARPLSAANGSLPGSAGSSSSAAAVSSKRHGLKKPTAASPGHRTPDLRSSKYRKLPGIGAAPSDAVAQTAGERQAKPQSASSARSSGAVSTTSVGSVEQIRLLPEVPKASSLFLSVFAQVHPVDEFRTRFAGYDAFFVPRKTCHAKVPDGDETFSAPGAMAHVHKAAAGILDDIMQDADILELFVGPSVSGESLAAGLEPAPYFSQFTTRLRNGVTAVDAATVDAVTAPVNTTYAGAEGDIETVANEDEARPLTGLLQAAGTPTKDGLVGGASESPSWVVPSLRDDVTRDSIIRLLEFQNSVESILEGTLFNLMLEADVGEFDLTKESVLVWFDSKVATRSTAP